MLDHELTRRTFLKTSLTIGFALAVQPVTGTTILSDEDELIAGQVQIPVGEGTVVAYRAMPNSETKLPVVLVVHEIFGVHEHIKDVCRRFARLGYVAIAPELFARYGDVGSMSDFNQIRPIVTQTPDSEVMSDLDAAAAWAVTASNGDPERLAVTGFCWGGRITWLYAAHNPTVRAAGAWYGRLVGEKTEKQPTFPVDVAPTIKVPVLGLYGGADQGIPVDTVEQMQEALKQGNSSSQIIIYPDTPHAFFADYRPSYRKEQAEDAWKKLQEWFTKYGMK